MSYAEQQHVQVDLPDLPVRAVEGDDQFLLDRHEREQEPRDGVEVEPEAGEEAL